MHGTLKQNVRRNRSAVSSGRRLFADRVPASSPRGRRFVDLVNRYADDCGGADRISETTRNHIRRVAFLQCVLEDAEAEYVKMGSTTLDERLEYQRLSNTQSRLMKKIGLFNASPDLAKDEHDDPLAYAERGGVRRPHRERLDDDEGA
ncbi:MULTISPECIES: hypothetical protein [unclassified Bradyrhizobium]|uniref:hypothetical protein n=1 Tax=unclassified Bradyrhizobium TaxID=2631580 RepID=UPI001FFBFC82|nr:MULTISPECIES: hypothetical protein [unclassified Bradyrhizobium]MCK1536442.1 hypothetical protein [Bradyrhizobium sp. 176]MCK1556511.1 hypothetical protein [Bradyrhizobium sp. 171]